MSDFSMDISAWIDARDADAKKFGLALAGNVIEYIRERTPVETGRLRSSIGMLKPAYQQVLRKHWGLGCDPLTLTEIGKPMKLSRERIRQIELEAIGILRKIYAKTLLREHPVEDLTRE